MTTNDGAFAQKIAGVLTIPYNDSSVKHALHVLETSGFSDITEKNLLNRVEVKLLSQVGTILEEFEPMYKGMRELGTNINAFKQDMNKINTRIDAVGATFAPMLRETQLLQREAQLVSSKLDTAKAFMDSFVVSEQESSILSSGGEIVPEFYQVFEKVKNIETNCSALLAEAPSLGERLLSDMSKLLSAAHEKLRLNIERNLRNDNLRSPQLMRDIQLLSQDPFVFKSVLDQIVELRKAAIKRDFQNQDHMDDEPERVVGMECAWIHSVMINEYDLMNSILSGQDHDSFTFTLFGATSSSGLVNELLDSILGSIDALFKQRINILIHVQKNVLDLDPIQNIIQFYLGVFSNHNQKTLTDTFKALLESVTAKFNHLVLSTVEKVKQTKKVSKDLAPPEFISFVFGLVRKVCTNYENSLNYDPLGDEYIKSRLDMLVDPLIDRCYKLSESLDPYSKQVYLLNCLDAMKLGLTGYVFANDKIETIDEMIDSATNSLSRQVYQEMQQEPGIDSMDPQELELNIEQWIEETNVTSTKKLEYLRSPSIGSRVAELVQAMFVTS